MDIKIKKDKVFDKGFSKTYERTKMQMLNEISESTLKESKSFTPILSGQLKNSLFAVNHFKNGNFTINSNKKYAIIVHNGLGYGKNSSPRPFVDKGFKKATSKLDKIMQRYIDKNF